MMGSTIHLLKRKMLATEAVCVTLDISKKQIHAHWVPEANEQEPKTILW